MGGPQLWVGSSTVLGYYCHLADYATSTTPTRVWCLYGSPFSQDHAVVKEVARFYDPSMIGPSFGVSSYVLLPGIAYPYHSSTIEGYPDYTLLQSMVSHDVEYLGKNTLVEWNELYLNDIL